MFFLALMTVLYFVPTMIAFHRGLPVGGIAVANFFLGWTGLGWLALCLYALIAQPRWVWVPMAGVPAGGFWHRG